MSTEIATPVRVMSRRMWASLSTRSAQTNVKCHVRIPDEEHFIYYPRSQPLRDPALWGRCQIRTVSEQQKDLTVQTLTAFGEDERNIPEKGVGNCHDWLAGAVAALEEDGLVGYGKGRFWRAQINCSANQMTTHCKDSDRDLQGEEKKVIDPADINARFNDAETRRIGKLSENSKFQDALGSLRASITSRSQAGGMVELPYYVSSPFISKTPNDNHTY